MNTIHGMAKISNKICKQTCMFIDPRFYISLDISLKTFINSKCRSIIITLYTA